MVKDIALKFLSATSAPIIMTLGSRLQTYNFDVKDFVLKVLGAHYFFTFGWILFILGMVIDWSQVFSSISSHDHNLGVKVTDFEFLC